MQRKGRTGNELHYCDKCKKMISKYVPTESTEDVYLFGIKVKHMKTVKVKPYYIIHRGEFCEDCYKPKMDVTHF